MTLIENPTFEQLIESHGKKAYLNYAGDEIEGEIRVSEYNIYFDSDELDQPYVIASNGFVWEFQITVIEESEFEKYWEQYKNLSAVIVSIQLFIGIISILIWGFNNLSK